MLGRRCQAAHIFFALGCWGLSLRTGAAGSCQKALLEVLIHGGRRQVGAGGFFSAWPGAGVCTQRTCLLYMLGFVILVTGLTLLPPWSPPLSWLAKSFDQPPFLALLLLPTGTEPAVSGQCPGLGRLACLGQWCGVDSGLRCLPRPHGGLKSPICEQILRTSKSSLPSVRGLLPLLKSLGHFPLSGAT